MREIFFKTEEKKPKIDKVAEWLQKMIPQKNNDVLVIPEIRMRDAGHRSRKINIDRGKNRVPCFKVSFKQFI